jgi:hypothetical protein
MYAVTGQVQAGHMLSTLTTNAALILVPSVSLAAHKSAECRVAGILITCVHVKAIRRMKTTLFQDSRATCEVVLINCGVDRNEPPGISFSYDNIASPFRPFIEHTVRPSQ